jgi:hypothetical protein
VKFGSIIDNPSTGWPEIDFSTVMNQGSYAEFFQQSFEWPEMTYVYYPYFWARQTKWSERLGVSGGDGLFNRFLQAGFARVIVPARRQHESDILYFLETGTIWSGTEPPVLGDPRYLSIVDELKESLGAPDGGVPEGEPWQFKLPTSLVMLDESLKLPEWPADIHGLAKFSPSTATCDGVPYNIAQWKDNNTIADAVHKLGYALDSAGDQGVAIKKAKPLVRAMQARFNNLGVRSLLGRPLVTDGIVGPCTLRALTYFDALREAGKWPGIA